MSSCTDCLSKFIAISFINQDLSVSASAVRCKLFLNVFASAIRPTLSCKRVTVSASATAFVFKKCRLYPYLLRNDDKFANVFYVCSAIWANSMVGVAKSKQTFSLFVLPDKSCLSLFRLSLLVCLSLVALSIFKHIGHR